MSRKRGLVVNFEHVTQSHIRPIEGLTGQLKRVNLMTNISVRKD